MQKRQNYARVGDTHTSTPSRTITSRPATQETKKARIRHGSPCTGWHVHAQSAQASLLKLEFPPASRAAQLGFDSLLANPRQMMIVDDDDKGCALRTGTPLKPARVSRHARHAQCAVLRCGCHRPVDADENNRKGRGHEKNLEGRLHQTWRRVRSRFMLELPTRTLWSTLFEHPFIIHVRHAPTHTPESRSQGIVIPRTKYVRYKHRSSHDTLFRSQVLLTRLPTWSCFFRTQASHPRAPNYLSSRRYGRSDCEIVAKRCASRSGPTQQPRTGIIQNQRPSHAVKRTHGFKTANCHCFHHCRFAIQIATFEPNKLFVESPLVSTVGQNLAVNAFAGLSPCKMF